VPGSKSLTNRAVLLAALADGPGLVTGVPDSRDTQLMTTGLAALGTRIDDLGGGTRRITPPERPTPAPDGIDCGLAGTVMRFLPPVAALAPGTTRFTGDPRASQRPLRPLLDALEQLGVRIASATGSVPFTLEAPAGLGGPQASIDASTSSQFVSGLLLAAARFPHGLDLRHTGGTVPSAPHIEMTLQALRDRGVDAAWPEPTRWIVRPGTLRAHDEAIEPDLTNAAAFLVAGVLSRGWTEVPGWPKVTTQPGDAIRGVLRAFGARAGFVDDPGQGTGQGVVRASWAGGLRGIDLDLHDASELTPVVAGLAAFAEGVTTIRGVGHIRGHETDRIAAITATLQAVGVSAEPTADGLVVHGAGAGAGVHGAHLKTYADHRMAHLGALLGLVVPGVTLDDVGATAKTMPDFAERWAAMLAGEPR